MTKPLTIGLVLAATIAGAFSWAKVDGARNGAVQDALHAPVNVVTQAAAAESEPAPVIIRMAQLAVTQPYMLDYERGPRIIHVPQPSERSNERIVRQPAVRASVERRPEPAVIEEDDDEEYVAPAPRPRVTTPKPRVVAPPPQPPAATTPRWKLRSESSPPPPPSGPHRAVLSAPPPSADGPTPLRPTPRFDGKVDKGAGSGEKFASPREPAAPAPVVSETQPPLGYSPPAMPEQPSDEVTSAAPAELPPEN